ncbi:pyridoxal phosphate-dependent decarboxylase family protein [Aeromicrobium sp. CF3.5]|uniref:pyridoxal phosphate-dependent decarboxylase family protein n=1 Tax=Aeromicrobium sp. CF3.5 TaxID=3373078 RepID=UPI003EE66647
MNTHEQDHGSHVHGTDLRGVGEFWGDESASVREALAWAVARMARESDPRTTARSASDLATDAGPTVVPAGIGSGEALRIFSDVLEPATRAQGHELNLAYIPAAPNRSAVAFDAVTGSANIFGGVWEAGAGGIHAENEVLAWLAGLLRWPDTAAGCFVSGGTTGNLSALVAARKRALRRRGARPAEGWTLVCTGGAHSSIISAAEVLDVAIAEVPVDSRGHMTGAALREVLERTPSAFAVVTSSGTTNTGIIDDLADVADACADHDVWMHVDGAYGGAALLAPSVRARFDGIERADSFIVDPHKWLFAPYDCCALLYRDAADARDAHSQHASYLDSIDREQPNPSDLALHLSRRVRGLPLWYGLATHGTDRYVEAIEKTLQTARDVATGIERIEHLGLLMTPELSVVMFDRPGWSEADYTRWCERLAHEGALLCVPTRWAGRTVLRVVFVNPDTSADVVLRILEETTR